MIKGKKLHLVKLLFRVISLPFLGIVFLAYPEIRMTKTVIAYTWYRNEDDYNRIVANSEENKDEFKTFEEWKKGALIRIDEYTKHRAHVYKIAMIPDNFMQWLKNNNLKNIVENREKYANTVCEEAKDRGIENNV